MMIPEIVLGLILRRITLICKEADAKEASDKENAGKAFEVAKKEHSYYQRIQFRRRFINSLIVRALVFLCVLSCFA